MALGTGAVGDLSCLRRSFARKPGQAQVFFTKDISSDGLPRRHARVTQARTLPRRVAVKLHSGEPGGHHFPAPGLIRDLCRKANGTIVECNTAYPGGRLETADHGQVLEDYGFVDIVPVDIMDAGGSISLPFSGGNHIQEVFVGSHFAVYDSFLMLSHFKGQAMGGFGGAIKNMAIGIASGEGKLWIHNAGATRDLGNFGAAFRTNQDDFLESMAEAAGAVMRSLEDRVVYINPMNHLSIDCDCDGHPAPPQPDDIGILASVDPVGLDRACVDLIYAADAEKGAPLRERMESRNGIHALDHATALGLGSQQYELAAMDG